MASGTQKNDGNTMELTAIEKLLSQEPKAKKGWSYFYTPEGMRVDYELDSKDGKKVTGVVEKKKESELAEMTGDLTQKIFKTVRSIPNREQKSLLLGQGVYVFFDEHETQGIAKTTHIKIVSKYHEDFVDKWNLQSIKTFIGTYKVDTNAESLYPIAKIPMSAMINAVVDMAIHAGEIDSVKATLTSMVDKSVARYNVPNTEEKPESETNGVLAITPKS